MNITALQEWADQAAEVFREMFDEATAVDEAETEDGLMLQAIIIGNLGTDPEIRYTASGDAVASLRIATSETWKDKQTGEWTVKKEAKR